MCWSFTFRSLLLFVCHAVLCSASTHAPSTQTRNCQHYSELIQGSIAVYASSGHLSGSLERAWNQTKKMLEEIKGKGLSTQLQKRPHHTKEEDTQAVEKPFPTDRVGLSSYWCGMWKNQLVVLRARAHTMFMRIVQQMCSSSSRMIELNMVLTLDDSNFFPSAHSY